MRPWWQLILSLLSIILHFCPAGGEDLPVWEQLVILKDTSNTWTKDKPADGWYRGTTMNTADVSQVDNSYSCKFVAFWKGANYWLEPARAAKLLNEGEKTGITWIADPALFTGLASKITYVVTPIDEQPRTLTDGTRSSDVLYCSGHCTLLGGRKLFTGGAWYLNLSMITETEFGLPYARMFDPVRNEFERIDTSDMPIGQSWYPTNALLPNGRVLVTGGLYQFTPDGKFNNPGLCLFDTKLYDSGKNPWIPLLNRTEVPSTIDYKPGLKDYTHFWVLHQPVVANNYSYTVAAMGQAARTYLLNVDPDTPLENRFLTPPNSQRPICNSAANLSAAWDSTAALLSTGELMTAGGCGYPNASSMISLYNVQTDSWRQFDLKRPRSTPSSVLLPDGTVLLINGEWTFLNQDNEASIPADMDPRVPQIFDPVTGTFVDDVIQPDGTEAFRGYHNWAVLLKDARVMTGGGVWQHGGVGCEHPSLRIYNPPYLRTSFPRPAFTNFPDEPLTLYNSSSPVELTVSGSIRSVSLMAFGASTHAFDQGQKYISVAFEFVSSKAVVRLYPFQNATQVLVPGDYVLYLISADGVPSIGKYVTLSSDTSPSGRAHWKKKHIWVYVILGICGLIMVVVVALIARSWFLSSKDTNPYKNM